MLPIASIFTDIPEAIDTIAKLVRLDQTFNSLATIGYAYGSNASLSTSRSASTVRAFPGTLLQDYQGWTHDALNHGVGGAFKIGSFRTCATTTWWMSGTFVWTSKTSAGRSAEPAFSPAASRTSTVSVVMVTPPSRQSAPARRRPWGRGRRP